MVDELASAKCCVCKESLEREDIVMSNPCSHFYVINVQENCTEFGGMMERTRKNVHAVGYYFYKIYSLNPIL